MRVFTQTFGVVAGIIERDGKILLVHEVAPGMPDNGKWSHPAGWIDVGENPLDAVQREVLEETGFTFTPEFLVGVYSLVREDLKAWRGGPPHGIKLVFTGTISAEQGPLHDDVDAVQWFTPEEIEAMDTATLRDLDIKKIVTDYIAGKRFPLDVVTHTVQTE